MGQGWMARARCRTEDPEAFFVRGAVRARRALAVCDGCGVRDECLGYALRNGIEHGIWGGLTEVQRRRLVRAHAG